MLPQDFVLSWEKLNVEFEQKPAAPNRKIIDNGQVRNANLVAVMGPSGSGKTTFLGCISGRSPDKTGAIKINGTIVGANALRTASGYVYQQDVFTETLTVFEQLKFVAKLKLREATGERQNTTIARLLTDLSLESLGETRIKHLSGGQKRRLSLAGEVRGAFSQRVATKLKFQLISNPAILFLDEPTTGLDSYSALMVVQNLQLMASSGKLIIAAIHQPSSQLFHYFNNIMLLAEGKLVFQGVKEEAIHFFESMSLFCPLSYNPADFYLRCLTYQDIAKMCEVFNMQKPALEHHLHPHSILNYSKNRTCFFHELKWLLWRNFTNIKRHKHVYFLGYFVVMIEVILLTQALRTTTVSSTHSVQNIQGFFYIIISEIAFTNMYGVITVFPEELAVFLREKNLYSIYSYFMSKIISIVPFCVLTCLGYTGILFLGLKFLSGFTLWLKFTYLTILLAVTSCSFGLAFSASCTTIVHAEMLMAPIETLFILLSGYFAKTSTVLAVLDWLKYLSPFYYGFSSFSNIFWQSIDVVNGNCTGNETIPCYRNGIEVLESYGLHNNYDTVLYNICQLHLLIIFFSLIGFVGIMRKHKVCSL